MTRRDETAGGCDWSQILQGKLRNFLISACICTFAGLTLLGSGTVSPVQASWVELGGYSYGANNTVSVSLGQINYVTGCSGSGGGIDDWIYPYADVYVVNKGGGMVDVSNSEGIPNTLFYTIIDEPIANTGPGGSLISGDYEIIIDECQNKKLDAIDWRGAEFMVRIPSYVDPLSSAAFASQLSATKSAANAQRLSWLSAMKSMSALFAAFNINTAISICTDPAEFILFACTNINMTTGQVYCSLTDAWKDLLGLQVNVLMTMANASNYYRGIAADPPDVNFRELPVLDGGLAVIRNFNEPWMQAAVRFGEAASQAQGLAKALLGAMEKYQGAEQGSIGEYAFVQARLVEDYARALAEAAPRVATAFQAVATEMNNSGVDFVSIMDRYRATQARVLASGLTSMERAKLISAGWNDTQINESVADFLARDFSGLANTSEMSAMAAQMNTEAASLASALTSFADAMATEQTNLTAQLRLPFPNANAGGPYTVNEGIALSLDASGSSHPDLPNSKFTFQWDLNQDGQFDDATGPTPNVTFDSEQDGYIGLKVSAPNGFADVSYARLTVNNVNSAPVITASSPVLPLSVPHDGSQLFSVTASDTDSGDETLTYVWDLDGTVVGSSATYTYAATLADAGPHIVTVTVRDNSPLSPDTRMMWAMTVLALDADGDGYGANVDCNDSNAAINPGATEIYYNGIDDDCEAKTPDDPDADNDGYDYKVDCDDANPAINPGATEICNGIDDNCSGAIDEGFDKDSDGLTTCGGDCDDNNAAIHPGAIEVCNGLDDNCDGAVDEGFDQDGDGFSSCGEDCNDNDKDIHPGALEVCNGTDDDCDGVVDEGFDKDGDGFTSCGGDCNDNDATAYPGAPELCDSKDNNCDGTVDEGVSADVDGDGFSACTGDCDDHNDLAYPGAPELCDNKDNDCNGAIDDGLDADGDGVSICVGDCNDADPSIYPNHPEIFHNGKDDDCNLATKDNYKDTFIIIPDESANLYYAKSTGDGTWSNFHLIDTLSGTIRGAAIADYDNDGDLDFVVGSPSGDTVNFYLFVNDGSDNFKNLGIIGSGTGSGSNQMDMAVGDFNHDGNMDFLGDSNNQYVHRGMGDGAGHFTVTTLNLGVASGRGMDSADFDHDGHLDYVRTVYGSGQVTLYRGDGLGNFTSAGVLSTSVNDPYGLTAADFNNDGHPDFIIGGSSTGDAYFFAGNGNGTFKAGVYVGSIDFNNHGAYDNYDFNGDGNQDLVSSTYSSNVIYYYPGNGNGTFGAAVRINPATSNTCLGISAPPGPPPAGDPIAYIFPPRVDRTPGATIELSGAYSSDNGAIAAYEWDFGDGTSGSGAVVTHTFPNQEGNYRVRLTVTDSDGRKSVGLALVRLIGAVPVADAGGPYTFGENFASGGIYAVTLDGSGSTDDSPIARYEWDFGTYLSDQFNGTALDTVKWAASTGVSQNEAVSITGASGWDNRYLVSTSSFVRQDGLIFDARVRPGAASYQHAMFGLKNTGTNYYYGQFVYALYFNSGSVSIYEDGNSRGNVTTYKRNIEYDIRIIMKSTGANYYMRPTGSDIWQLIYQSTYSTLSPVRFGGTVYADVFTVDEAKVFLAFEGATPVVRFPEGSYPVTLKVTDIFGQTATDSTSVNLVKGAAPVANPGGPYTPGEAQANCGNWTVALNGSGSTDDGGIYGYSWNFGDGTAAGTGATPSHVFAGNTPRTVTLTVTDNALLTNSATAAMTPILGAPPVANPGGPYTVNESVATGGLWTVNLNGSASSDDVGLCDYQWNFGDGGTGTGATPSHNYAAAGVYTVALTVRDHALQSHTATTTVTVNANDAPVASHGGPYAVNESAAHGGKWTVAFNASASTDDYGIWKYEWTFGDGATGTGVSPSHDYAAIGTYPVTLVVTDDGRLTNTVTTPVVVSKNNPPVADSGGPYTLDEGDADNGSWKFVLDGSGSTDDFAIYKYGWALDPTFKDDFAGTVLDGTAWTYTANVAQNNGGTITGAANWGTQYLFSKQSITRKAGTTFEARITPQNLAGNQHAMWGFKNNNATYQYGQMPHAIYFNNNAIEVYENGGGRGQFASYTRNVTYDIRIVLKAQGATYYYKAASSSSWITLYDSTSSAESPLRYGVDCHSGTNFIDWLSILQTSSAVKPSFTYAVPGVYGSSLTVTDNALQTSTEATSITITQGEPPVANAGNDITTEGHWPVSFNGGGSTDDFAISKYEWTFGDGKTGLGKTPSHIYWTTGDFTATLKVYDKVLQSDTDTVTVHVVTADPPVANAGGPYTAGVGGPPAYFNGNASTDDYGIVKYLWDVDDKVDSDGDGNFTNDMDVVGRTPFYVYAAAGTYAATLTVEDGAGQRATASATVNVAANLAPDVVCVPWVATDPLSRHETYNGRSIRLKAIVRDAGNLTYQWDFGDGSAKWPATPAAVANKYAIEASHTYPSSPENTPFTATLSVWDSAGLVGTDQYHLIVRADNLETKTNVAIDEGLWYTHKTQTKSNGQWASYGGYYASATGSAIQAFEINGHLQEGDNQEDPYVETVNKGLGYMFLRLRQRAIGVQTYGDPDTNGNGIGIEVDSDRPIYEGGMVMDAIASSSTPLAFATTGGANVKGRFYYDILTDMVDAYAWGQDDSSSTGGWRYSWNDWPDNSACQWAAIGMHAAQDTFGINIPQWVKDRVNNWLRYSYDGTGFGYTGPGNGVALTPSGMVQMSFAEQTTDDPRWQTAENQIANNWFWQNNNYYAVYALTKSLKLAKPHPVVNLAATGLDWYNDPTTGVRKRLIDQQYGSTDVTNWGSWASGGYGGRGLDTSWAVIMLTPTLFVQPPVADAGSDIIWAYGQELKFDASGSFHKDPIRSIVKYEWDFNGDGVWDLTTTDPSDPSAKFTYVDPNPGVDGDPPQTVIAKLRVTDNNDPAQSDIDTREVIVAEPPHAPFANAGGPYLVTAGISFSLDGSNSFDIDPGDSLTKYQWDLDNDGVWFDNVDVETTQGTVSYTYNTPGTFSIGLKVLDKGAFNPVDCTVGVNCVPLASAPSFATVTVVPNLPPVADANGPYTVEEGSIVTLDGTGSSDPNGDALTYRWDLDNDGQYDDATGVTPSFAGLDDGTYTVGLQVSDSLLTGAATSTVTVVNVAPAVNAGQDKTINEGAAFVSSGTFTDKGAMDSHTASVDYGDGSGPQVLMLSPGGNFGLSHVYADNNTYTVTVTVTDDDNGVGADTVLVTVGNVPPTVNAGSDMVIDENSVFVSTGAFTDPGKLDTHTATVDYGDGSGAQQLDFSADGIFTLNHLYADNGSYTVTVSVQDNNGGVGADTASVTVRNLAPRVDAGADKSINEGSAFVGRGSFADPGTKDTHTATVDYGDGSGVQPLALSPDGNFDLTHVYADNGSYTVTVVVTDNGGAIGSDTAVVAVANLAPSVDAGADQTINEGSTFVSSGSFTDPGSKDTHTATVDYGDGSGSQALALSSGNTFTLNHIYADNGTFTVTVTVTDKDGASAADSAMVTVDNVVPVVDAGADQIVNEGSMFAGSGSFVDPGTKDTHTATVNYGDGSGDQPLTLSPDGSFALTHVYSDNGIYTVTVVVTDNAGGVGSDTAGVIVTNVILRVDAGLDQTINEGSAYASSGSFVDPGVNDTHTATVNYGDGSGEQALALRADGSFALDHVYADNGAYIVTVVVTDNAGGAGSDTALVTVLNALPVVDAGPDQTLSQGDLVSLAGSFTDLGVADTHTIAWTFGDGGSAAGSLTPTHVFTAPGSYVVTLTVTDDDGGAASDQLTITVNAGTSPICGDLDHDRDVDAADRNLFMTAYRSCVGTPKYNAEANYDGDSCITGNDYREWYICFRSYVGDFDNDGDVDGADLAAMAKAYSGDTGALKSLTSNLGK